MSKFELTGTIIEIFPAQTFGKGFRKREFVIEHGDKYPQKIIFQLTQEKCNLIDSYTVGDQITVHFNVTGRDWTDKMGQVKYFNSLEAWRLVGDSRPKQKIENDDPFGDDPEFWGDEKPKQKASRDSMDSLLDDDLPF
jgi:hypothetical protein